LAGDVPVMAQAELEAVFEAHGFPLTKLRSQPRFYDGHAEIFLDDAVRLSSRLGLAHNVSQHLFDGVPGSWTEGARDCCFPTGIPFAARGAKVDPEARWDTPAVEREVGALLAPGRPVDLSRPRLLARCLLLADRIYVGQQLWESEPAALRARHVDARPFSSPVSLEPRLARALVNLARVRAGDLVLDPFCGTGGVLLEAAELGARILGSDLDHDMVAGTRSNLAHFGHVGDVAEADIADVPDLVAGRSVDAVVSDLPYGRSASTGREPMSVLYARAFDVVARVLRPGGHAVLGLPDATSAAAASAVLEERGTFLVRAHKSLTRHFVVLRAPVKEAPPPEAADPAPT
jgi:tRNA (guanine10-N2)-dimethyltransferase